MGLGDDSYGKSDRPPTDLLPYLKGLDGYSVAAFVGRLSAQNKWDELTRSSLFDLAGYASSSVRGAAFGALQDVSITADERILLEGYLARTSVDVRQGVVKMLIGDDDELSFESVDRLLSAGRRSCRLAASQRRRWLV